MGMNTHFFVLISRTRFYKKLWDDYLQLLIIPLNRKESVSGSCQKFSHNFRVNCIQGVKDNYFSFTYECECDHDE